MRCRNCKEKFEPIRFNMKYCLNDECVRVWVESEKAKVWKKTKAKAKLDLMTLSDYLKLTQQIFNNDEEHDFVKGFKYCMDIVLEKNEQNATL